MGRLTTDQPQGNLQNALNLFYVKDREVWVRGGGPEPQYQDVRLHDFIRETIRNTADEERTYIEDSSDEELSEGMMEWLTDGNTSIEGLIGTLYTAAWAFAEIRERLKTYEDAEAAGRLVMLPCKVGDTVYDLRPFYCHGKVVRKEIVSGKVDCFAIRSNGNLEATVCLRSLEFIRYKPEELILTREDAEAVLTREEAEAAMRKVLEHGRGVLE